ncbi:MAG: PrsW family intramembrane metalloprotease [Candidatus Staskawiczbacteria bacterium]
MDFIILIYIILGLLPSSIWLSFYLKKDLHPEPKRMILKIFFWGALITIPVFFVQIGLTYLLGLINLGSLFEDIIYWFVIIAFSEEYFKYLVIRVKIFNSPHLDEPLDAMLYMVVSALGFAAVENILYLFSPAGSMSFDDTVNRAIFMALIRFVGATFLHTLCSALIGYYLAISFSKSKKKYLPFITGSFMAVFFHGLYNYSLMTSNSNFKIVVPIVIILVLATLVFSGFSKLKKMASICKIS